MPSVTRFVNVSLAEGCFKYWFKKVVVTHLRKEIKNSSLPSKNLKNYLPISGFCFMSKLVE